jgi:methionine aminopeptidase
MDQRWPEIVSDGSLSVHYEHDVLVTPEGPRILTEGMEQLPDVIG